MKTNLDESFKSDVGLEREGIWLDWKNGIKFKVRRLGGSNDLAKAAMAKHFKRHAKAIEQNLLPEKVQTELYTRAFVEGCLAGWEGVEIDGQIQEFDVEVATKLLLALPNLTDVLVEYASNADLYKEQYSEEDLGNS